MMPEALPLGATRMTSTSGARDRTDVPDQLERHDERIYQMKAGFFSMTGLAMTSALAGFLGVVAGHRAIVLAGVAGLAAAAAIGGATVITLQVMASRGRRSHRR